MCPACREGPAPRDGDVPVHGHRGLDAAAARARAGRVRRRARGAPARCSAPPSPRTGVEIDTQGDAFFVAFPTADGAASAAPAGTDELSGGPIRVRIGLHTGAPTVAHEGYVGVGVHRGRAIAALAHGGQVVVSPTTAALLDSRPLADLGLHRLKDFDGATRLFQLGGGEFPDVRTPGSVSLPDPATAFIGREQELLDAIGLVFERDPRVLTVVGPGRHRQDALRDRARPAARRGGRRRNRVHPARPASRSRPRRPGPGGGTRRRDGRRRVDRRQASGKRTHVVLDNVEQLLPAAAAPLAALAEAAPSLRLLVTSREALRIGAETELDLPPLPADDAAELFVTRARAMRGDVTRSATVDELCERLDRLPLALELAAARVKLLSPEALLQRLGERLDLPAPRDADPRHATLNATIAWSYELLTDAERVLFARIAVFRGGCTLEAAERVCGADLDTLASLLDKSLLRRLATDGLDRFWMLETIREFALARLAESGAGDTLRRAHAEWLLDLTTHVPRGAAHEILSREQLDLLTPELDNVRAALEWALAGDPALGLELAVSLEEFWVIREPFEGAGWEERLLEAASDAPPHLRASGLRALAGALDIVGEHDRAAPLYQASLELFEQLDDDAEAAYVRFRIGANHVNREEHEVGWPLIEASLRTSDASKSRHVRCRRCPFWRGRPAGRTISTAPSGCPAKRSCWLVRSAGCGGWATSSSTPPSSNAAVATPLLPPGMRARRLPSRARSATACTRSSRLQSSRALQPRSPTPSRPAGSGARSSARRRSA